MFGLLTFFPPSCYLYWCLTDSNGDKRLWNANLGKCEFSLAYILLFRMQSSSRELRNPSFSRIPNPNSLVSLSREFTSWIIWGRSGEESAMFFSNAIDLAIILLGHNQYKATEVFFFFFFSCLSRFLIT